MTLENPKKAAGFQIFSWCLFDWANSAFATVVITFVFGTYFMRSVADSVTLGTAYWGWMLAASGIAVALLSPIWGSIADYTGKRKLWLAFFTGLNIVCTALLFFILPSPFYILPALILLFIANIAYEFTQVFYNAMMTSLTTEDRLGRISGWGWSFGYFGGLACLAIALFFFVRNGTIGTHMDVNVRSTNLLVAAWFLVFSLPLFLFVADEQKKGMPLLQASKKGIKELIHTFKQVSKYKNILLFLVAHLVYIDGLSTLFVFAGLYAAGTFHMSYSQILVYAMALNISAGVGAALFAWIDDWIGPKFTICFSLIMMILSGVVILLTTSVLWYWILSAFLGLFVGPVQAASRSYMARISPKEQINQMFGIYQLSGRITTFIGPLLVGSLTRAFHSQRVGLTTVFVMMLIGFLILLKVPKPEKTS